MLLNIKLIKILSLFFILFFCIPFTNLETNQSNNIVNQLGNNSAKYTLVEYASMSCVHCANFHNNEFPKIKRDFIGTGKIKFVYKDFPLDKPAMFASMVTNCFTGEQYYEILSSLYRNQEAWVTKSNNTGTFYNAIHNVLKVNGVSLKKILECVDDKSEINKKTWNSIIATRLEGQKIGVNSTPSFFLNGKKIEEAFNYGLLKQLIK